MLAKGRILIHGKTMREPSKFSHTDLFYFIRMIWPLKRTSVKPFCMKPLSRTVPLQYFNERAVTIAECKDIFRIGIGPKLKFDNCGKTGKDFSKNGSVTGNIYGLTSRKLKHSFLECLSDWQADQDGSCLILRFEWNPRT